MVALVVSNNNNDDLSTRQRNKTTTTNNTAIITNGSKATAAASRPPPTKIKKLKNKRNKQKRTIPFWLKLTLISVVIYVSLMFYFLSSFKHEILQKEGEEQQGGKKKKKKNDDVSINLISHRKEEKEEGKKIFDKKDDEKVISGSSKEETSISNQSNKDENNNDNNRNNNNVIDASFLLDNIKRGEEMLSQQKSDESNFPRRILTAYVETQPLDDEIPDTGNQGDPNKEKDIGVPPLYKIPLPIRSKTTPYNLQKQTYPKLQTCYDIPSKIPTDRGIQFDSKNGQQIIWNSGNTPTSNSFEKDELPFCPVDADPFLPWLHDIFPSADGQYVEFIAHNKRRCNGDPKLFKDDLNNLEPQVSIMQSVPIKRISDTEAQQILMKVAGNNSKSSSNNNDNDVYTAIGGIKGGAVNRYRLASYEEADIDGKETRFICRFKTYSIIDSSSDDNNNSSNDDLLLKEVILNETLSVYPYNYEYANYKKPGSKSMLTPIELGKKDEQIWNSILHFRCPIPEKLQTLVSSGQSVVNDIATIYLDLVPIRTYPRRKREGYMPGVNTTFNPDAEWGKNHVLPLVEASGRLSNIPICHPPILDVSITPTLERTLSIGTNTEATSSSTRATNNNEGSDELGSIQQRKLQRHHHHHQISAKKGMQQKQEQDVTLPHYQSPRLPTKHHLVGCVWASSAYTTRGDGVADTSTSDRLLEWLTYHLYIAKFDHIYVYDNSQQEAGASPSSSLSSGGFSNNNNKNRSSLASTLKPVTDIFPSNQVTRISWPHRVCNNNRPANSNPGERSSQYEASCRVRYGPHTKWMAAFDADEYFIPMGKWKNLKHWLQDGVEANLKDKAHILSFFQTRALPNVEFMEPYNDDHQCGSTTKSSPVENSQCLQKRSMKTFMEVYDCEPTPLPKPEWGWRAKKQIFKPWYVLNHYVHYTTVSKRLLDSPHETSPRFVEKKPYERRVDELNEAFMLHAKTTSPEKTVGWKEKCLYRGNKGEQDNKSSSSSSSSCPIGIAWPLSMNNRNNNGGNEAEKELFNSNGMKYNCYQHERVIKEIVPKLKKSLSSLRSNNEMKQ